MSKNLTIVAVTVSGIVLMVISIMLVYSSAPTPSLLAPTQKHENIPAMSQKTLSEIALKITQGLKQTERTTKISKAIPFSCSEKPTSEEISRCPEDDLYLALWRLLNKNKKKWTVVNVGSNKGYSLAQFCDALNVRPFTKQHLGIDLYNYAEKSDLKIIKSMRWSLGGVCCDATEKSIWEDERIKKNKWFLELKETQNFDPKTIDPGFDVEVWGIDATTSHIEYTTKYFDKYMNDEQRKSQPNTKIKFVWNRVAVAEKEGVVKFPQAPLGVEVGSMLPDDVNAKSSDESKQLDFRSAFWEYAKIKVENVTMTTLDKLMPAELDQIDVLLTDTEGFDFDVQAGAIDRFFKTGKVGIYVLELQPGISSIGKRKLGDFVKDMSKWGFECYFPIYGKGGNHRTVANVTFDPREEFNCWDDRSNKYDEFRGWYNMVCAGTRQNPELREVFAELQKTPTTHEYRECNMNRLKKEFFGEFPDEVSSDWMEGKK